MGDFGKSGQNPQKDFLPEDIFADTEKDSESLKNTIVIKDMNDYSKLEESISVDVDNNQKKGKKFNFELKNKTSIKIVLLVLVFSFLIFLGFFIFNVLVTSGIFNFVADVSKSLPNKQVVKNQDVVDYENIKDSPSELLKDTDSDGLLDIEESNFKTNINKIDTDDDGVNDSDEVKVYKTNPINIDTDGDGITDFDEIFIYKINPLSSDTDGDGYRDLEEINNFYKPNGAGMYSSDDLMDIGKLKEQYKKN